MRIGIAFDIDGVLIRGKRVLPQAIRAIRRVQDARVPFVLLTNGGGTTEAAKAKELSRVLDSDIRASQMVLAHTPMAPLAANYSNVNSNAVLILGKSECKDAALAYGFKYPVLAEEILVTCPEIWPFRAPSKSCQPISLDRKIGAILSFHDSQDWGRDAQIICDLMRTGGDLRRVVEPHHRDRTRHLHQHHTPPEQLPLYFSAGDFVWSNNLPLTRFAQGAFRYALETVYSRLTHGKPLEYTMYGKPHKVTYDYAQSAIDAHAVSLSLSHEVPIMPCKYFGIGDNPESDIAGANNNGWTSILVKTGVYESGPHEAKYLVADVEEAVDVILSQPHD
ncbi:Haloacid dehalogenase-like hydrolase domain-containing 5 [Chytriomyces hyalinus]|nr:Haloacid dehalogenase-like hydrolase domain-containing 5 [Chytriomyces hyalinus]